MDKLLIATVLDGDITTDSICFPQQPPKILKQVCEYRTGVSIAYTHVRDAPVKPTHTLSGESRQWNFVPIDTTALSLEHVGTYSPAQFSAWQNMGIGGSAIGIALCDNEKEQYQTAIE